MLSCSRRPQISTTFLYRVLKVRFFCCTILCYTLLLLINACRHRMFEHRSVQTFRNLLISVIYCLQMVVLKDYWIYYIDFSTKNRTDPYVWSISQRSRADRLRAQDRRTGDLQRQNAFQGNPIPHMHVKKRFCHETVYPVMPAFNTLRNSRTEQVTIIFVTNEKVNGCHY